MCIRVRVYMLAFIATPSSGLVLMCANAWQPLTLNKHLYKTTPCALYTNCARTHIPEHAHTHTPAPMYSARFATKTLRLATTTCGARALSTVSIRISTL